MRLEQLVAFLAVVDTGSFQKAALECGVTQSTVSRQIQALEAALGIQLLHRTTQIRPTLGGETFLPYARKICRDWCHAIEDLQELMDGHQREFCVAAIHSVGAYYLPPILQQFCQDYPQVHLRVTALGSDRALKVLKDGLVDVALVMHNPQLNYSPEIVVDALYDEPIEVLMAANHPLTQYMTVPWEELAQYGQVVFRDGYGMQRLVQKEFQQQGLSLKVAMEVNTLDAFRGMIRQGDLIALLPRGAIADGYQDTSLAVRSTASPQIQRKVVMLTTQDRLKIPPIQHFRQLVCQHLVQPASVCQPALR
jgi:DNA-binding transcriptional LysR family regulator